MSENVSEITNAIFGRLRRLLLSEQWAVGIVKSPICAFLDESFTPAVHWVRNSSRTDYLADCFGVLIGDRKLILAERFSYRGSSRYLSTDTKPSRMGRGHIASISIDNDGNVISVDSVIDTGQHISYPCTICDRGSWYSVAEEESSNRANLYRREGNGRWSLVKELLPHAVIDPTVFKHNGLWWMFGTLTANPFDELLIWSADQLEGEWQPHPGNPLHMNRSNCRSGGTPFLVGNALYRPTQNCATTYGGSIVINKVDELTRTSFEEHPVREVHPLSEWPFKDGLHTLSAFGEWTLIDAKREVISPWITARKIARHVIMLSKYIHSASWLCARSVSE